MKSRVLTNNEKYQVHEDFSSTAWNHFCTTWIPTTVKFYINGTFWNSDSDGGTVASPQSLGDSKILLGGLSTDSPTEQDRNFVMDEFVFWHRGVLSDAEVWILYNSYW